MSSTPDLDRALQIAAAAGMGRAALDRARDEVRAMKELLSGKTLYDARQATLIEVAQWCENEALAAQDESAALHRVAAHCWALHSHGASNAERSK